MSPLYANSFATGTGTGPAWRSLRSAILGGLMLCLPGLTTDLWGQVGTAQWNRMVLDIQHQGWIDDLERIERGSVLAGCAPEIERATKAYSDWAQQLIMDLESAAGAETMADQVIQGLEAEEMLRWRLLRTLSDRHRVGTELALEDNALPAEWVQLPGVLTGWNPAYYGPDLRAGHWALSLLDAARAGLIVRRGFDERHRAAEADLAAMQTIQFWTEKFPGDPVRQVVGWMRGSAAAVAFSLATADRTLLQALQRLRVLIQLDHNLVWDQSDALWLIRSARLDSCSCPNPWQKSALSGQGISKRWLQQENPWHTTDSIPAGAFIALPEGAIDTLDLTKVCAQTEHIHQPSQRISHTVQSGEVLGSIARKYGVLISDLRAWNEIQGDMIQLGQRLDLYGVESISTPVKSGDTQGIPFTMYTVLSGDNLWRIASKYPGVSSDDLIQLNQLISLNIRPGQLLKIPRW